MSIGGGLTPDQARTLYSDMVNQGVLTQKQADFELAQALQGKTPGGLENNSTIRALDDHPPAEPNQYAMPKLLPDGADYLKSPDAQAVDQYLRSAVSAGGFSKDLGDAVLETIVRLGEKLDGFTPAQHELYGRESAIQLQKLFGERTQERIEAARSVAAIIEQYQPGFLEMLTSTGLGNSVELITYFASQHDRIRAMRGEL